MKQVLLTLVLLLSLDAFAQPCTTSSNIDACPPNTPVSETNFNNPILFSGTALTKGARYKFENVLTVGTPPQILDAIVTIDSIHNATMTGAQSPSIDDNSASDQNNQPIVGLFAPRIAPDQALTCTDRIGFVQFTITFYPDFTGSTLPSPVVVSNLNFVHYDIDGFVVNSSAGGVNGSFREIGYVRKISANNPVNLAATPTELIGVGTVNEPNASWLLTFGSTVERTGVSKCAEVAYASNFLTAQTSVTFRMGYEYKAPVPCNNANTRPTRQYGMKSGCFNLPGGGPLPVSFTGLNVALNQQIATVSWHTLQEFNVRAYEIYRSVDGTNFTPVGTVAARNVLTRQTYQFRDDISSLGQQAVVFYKVRVIDIDDSYRYSPIVSMRVGKATPGKLAVTPNPTRGDAQLRFTSQQTGIATIRILDAAGRVVLEQQTQVMPGTNQISLQRLTNLAEGTYAAQVILGQERMNTAFVLWR
jgi:hypothetical protein